MPRAEHLLAVGAFQEWSGAASGRSGRRRGGSGFHKGCAYRARGDLDRLKIREVLGGLCAVFLKLAEGGHEVAIHRADKVVVALRRGRQGSAQRIRMGERD